MEVGLAGAFRGCVGFGRLEDELVMARTKSASFRHLHFNPCIFNIILSVVLVLCGCQNVKSYHINGFYSHISIRHLGSYRVEKHQHCLMRGAVV